MERIRLRQAVVVEGKYDKIKLSALIDGTILCTGGFRIYRDRQLAAMIRAVAQRQGIVILTDSDRAGFRIRSYIRSLAKGAEVINLYIPQVPGKERRKEAPGAEGILGVEGMEVQTLRDLFSRAGLLEPDRLPAGGERRIERSDFYEDGISGGPDASRKRAALLARLGLPGYVTTNALLDIINSLMTWEEYRAFCREYHP